MPASLIELKDFLGSIAQPLPKVTWKRMFGCDAVFADGIIFGLIWKEGRIGLKLLNDSDFSKLRATSGTAPWKAGPMTMSRWVLVPKTWHSQKSTLVPWVKKAHAQALGSASIAPNKTKSKAKAVKKPAQKSR